MSDCQLCFMSCTRRSGIIYCIPYHGLATGLGIQPIKGLLSSREEKKVNLWQTINFNYTESCKGVRQITVNE